MDIFNLQAQTTEFTVLDVALVLTFGASFKEHLAWKSSKRHVF